MINRRDEEAFNIRFQPDALVQHRDAGEDTYILIEYKATTTPRYSFRNLQWDRGQIEADPWEYYLRQIQAGERLAILNYCSFHSRPLLCDYPTADWQVGGRQTVSRTATGSGTDFYNTDLRMMRPFEQFMEDEFGVPQDASLQLIRDGLAAVLNTPLLQTTHDPNSRHFGSTEHETGFNWDRLYQQVRPMTSFDAECLAPRDSGRWK